MIAVTPTAMRMTPNPAPAQEVDRDETTEVGVAPQKGAIHAPSPIAFRMWNLPIVSGKEEDIVSS